MPKYLYNHWYTNTGPCAMKIRWNDPTYTGSLGSVGEVTLGS